MGNFRERVGLVQELRQLAGAEEGVDDRGQGTRVDQVNGGEHFVVAHVHALADCAGHTGQADPELGEQLLPYRAHPAVAQVVNIVYIRLLVHQADEVFDDRDDIFFREHERIFARVQLQFAVDFIPAYLPEVVAFVGEEQLFDDAAGSIVIGCICTAELLIDIADGVHFGVGRVLLQRIVDDRVIEFDAFLLEDDHFGTGFQDEFDIILIEDDVAFEDNLVAFDGHHLAGIFVHEVFQPGAQDAGGQFAADSVFEVSAVSGDFVG